MAESRKPQSRRHVTNSVSARREGARDRDAQIAERCPLMFDPWLTSSHRFVTATADNITAAREARAAPRLRKVKQRDRENIQAIMRTIFANLAYAAVIQPEAAPVIGISLRTSKQPRSRYDRRGFTRLPDVLKELSGTLLTLVVSTQKGVASNIIASSGFGQELRRFRFGEQHFAQAEGRETICLSRTERDYVEGTATREWIDYEDTSETRRYRAEMATINAFLAKADLAMAPDGSPPVITSIRHLRRYFNLPPGVEANERFDLGGRLFGGWWQQLPRGRRQAIRIKGEPIADLDFSSMFLRLAYLQAGLRPPDGDLYAMVTDLSDPQWREGVKKLVSSMLFRTSPLAKIPRDLKGELPAGVWTKRLRTAILEAHPALAATFETGIGFRLMFVESKILVHTLLRLTDQRIPALAMHDGLMVARSKAGAAMVAMTEACREITGHRLPISLKM